MISSTLSLNRVFWPQRPAASFPMALTVVLLVGLAHAGLLWLLQRPPGDLPKAAPPQLLSVRWVEAEKPHPSPQPEPKSITQAEPKPLKPQAKMPVKLTASPVSQPIMEEVAADSHSSSAPSQSQPSVAPAPPDYIPARVDAAYLANPAPAYPAAALRARQQGRVLLRVLVAVDGSAQSVEVEHGSGFELLDASAQTAVSRWKFQPGRRDGVAIADWVLVPIQFSLRS